jgi:hypothetical protein
VTPSNRIQRSAGDKAHVATLSLSDELIRRAVFSFWLRGVGWKALLTTVVIVVILALEIGYGSRSWIIGALGTLLLVAVGLVMLIYTVHLRQAMDRFRQLKVPKAVFVAETDSFTLTSDLGSSTMQWKAVYAIWKFDDYWLMLFSRSQFVTLPLADIPVQMREFILDRTARHTD